MKFDSNWNDYQKALYWDQQGDWDQAHEIVQDLLSREAAWIHAYLHRKEGDEWNAGYWYRTAGMEFFKGSLVEEWEMLWEEMTAKS